LRPARQACAVAILGLALGCGAEPAPPLHFTPALLPSAAVDQPYLGTLAISGNLTPIAEAGVSSGSLPPGLVVGVALPLTLNELQVSGTPTAAGTFQFTLRVACFGTNRPGQRGEQAYSLLVAP
jgi:hypothetical protein